MGDIVGLEDGSDVGPRDMFHNDGRIEGTPTGCDIVIDGGIVHDDSVEGGGGPPLMGLLSEGAQAHIRTHALIHSSFSLPL